MQLMMKGERLRTLSSFVALVKFRYHVTFLNVIFGALIFAPRLTAELFFRLAVLYVCFNVLLYGGIYALNDLADRESDRRHPLKRLRPMASGAISPQAGLVFGLCLIFLGFSAASLVFSPSVIACFGAVVAINAAYSAGGRNMPYLDLVLNALPHTIRFLMGALLVGRVPRAAHLSRSPCWPSVFLACGGMSNRTRQPDRKRARPCAVTRSRS